LSDNPVSRLEKPSAGFPGFDTIRVLLPRPLWPAPCATASPNCSRRHTPGISWKNSCAKVLTLILRRA